VVFAHDVTVQGGQAVSFRGGVPVLVSLVAA
jgi:hypothetical protein